jgi:hypothetical protein
MATKKTTKSKRTASKKGPSRKSVKRPKKLAKKKSVQRRAAKGKTSSKKRTPKKRERLATPPFSPGDPGRDSGGQSGDLQGLSRRRGADSESVDELLEEGNAFEAEAVMGVGDADAAEEREVHTHEVPEDDVPGEYLDEE